MGVKVLQYKIKSLGKTEFWLNFQVFGFVYDSFSQDDNSVYEKVIGVIVQNKSINHFFVREHFNRENFGK